MWATLAGRNATYFRSVMLIAGLAGLAGPPSPPSAGGAFGDAIGSSIKQQRSVGCEDLIKLLGESNLVPNAVTHD
jgi:hypothetical protein